MKVKQKENKKMFKSNKSSYKHKLKHTHKQTLKKYCITANPLIHTHISWEVIPMAALRQGKKKKKENDIENERGEERGKGTELH